MESKYYFVAFVYHLKDEDMKYRVANHYVEQKLPHFSPRTAELELMTGIELSQNVKVDNIVVVNYKEVSQSEYLSHFDIPTRG